MDLNQSAPPLRRRRRRRTQTARLGLPREALESALLFFLVLAPALALGAVHTPVLAVIAGVSFLAILLLRPRAPSSFSALCLAVGVYSALQAAPLPLSWLEAVAPHNAEVWRESLRLVNGVPPVRVPLSFDPGASLKEALKWLFFAGVVLVAARLAHTQGLRAVLRLVFLSATCVAVVTLLHGTLGAERVYGFYERSFADTQWALSPLVNSNNLAGSLNLGIFCGLALWPKTEGNPSRASLAAGVALMGALSLTSGSRGAVGTLLLGIFLVTLVHAVRAHGRGKSKFAWGLVGGAVLLIAFSISTVLALQGSASAGLRETNLLKLHMIKWVAPLVLDFPWFGAGAGAFETAFLPYRASDDDALWTHPENFLVGWCTELGLPLTVLMLAAVILLFWRGRRRTLGTERTLAWISVSVWFLHNCFDLAITVPGAFAPVVAVLGALSAPLSTSTGVETARENREAAWRSRFPLLLSGTGLLMLSLNLPLSPDLREDRVALHRKFQGANLAVAGQGNALLAQVSAAVRRHPGDPYLLRLGAIAASADPEGSPLKWLGRALDRDPKAGRTHLLLAHELWRRGARSQALLELKLVVKNSPSLAAIAARQALAWTREPKELKRIVPPGAEGTDALLALADGFRDPEFREVRESFLREALLQNPASGRVRLALAEELLDLERRDASLCEKRKVPCLKEISRHLTAVKTAKDVDDLLAQRALEAEAERRALAGDPEGAVRYLLENCPPANVSCARKAVLLAANAHLNFDEAARVYLAVACPETECGAAHRLLAQQYAQLGQLPAALMHTTKALEESRTADDALSAAQLAATMGLRDAARRFLAQLKYASPEPTPPQRARAAALEAQLSSPALPTHLP